MLTYTVGALCAAIFVRLFTYRREGARFRRWVSVLAAVVMGCCGATVIYIVDGQLVFGWTAWPVVVLLGVLAASTLRCGGNLSAVLRGPDSWDGRDRRTGEGRR